VPFKARILSAYDALRSSYWFLPSLMALGALLLSYATLWVDEHTSAAPAGWFYTGTPEGARSVLAVIAGSMISTVGLVFSIVIVALQLASSQFGPRLLRTFVRDTANQIVLGTFIAAFLYALMILRNVHGSVADSRTFVPQVSMLTAVALALGGIGVLIYFIHHTAAMIQAPNVINAVALDLHDALAVLSADAEQAHARAIALASTPSERDRVEAAYGAFHRARAAARPRRPLTPPSRSA
jgi:uncharacterized membrane protein